MNVVAKLAPSITTNDTVVRFVAGNWKPVGRVRSIRTDRNPDRIVIVAGTHELRVRPDHVVTVVDR